MSKSRDRASVNHEVRLNVQLKEWLYKDLQRIAGYFGQTVSDVVRMLIIEYVREKRQELMEVFNDDRRT